MRASRQTTPAIEKNLAGIESEVHIVALGRARAKLRQEASRIVRRAVLRRHGLWRCRDCDDSDNCGRSEFLSNGARCYIDHGYLEYSTPCSWSTREVVAATRAGDVVVREAVQEVNRALAPKGRVMAVRNTCDHHGHTYAAHVNVSMTRQAFDRLMEDKGEFLHETLGPMLASLPLICGAGRAGSDQGEDIFQISQRADYIRTERGLQTVSDRPLLNTRDEPLADGRRHARLHVICLDADRLDTPSFLKVGILRLMCAAMDLHVPTAAIPVVDPVRALHSISRSPFTPIRLSTGRTITALGIQELFLSALSKRANELAERIPDVSEILQTWESVLAGFRRDYIELVGVLDWVTKFALLEVARKDANLRWSDPRLAWMDISYHALTPGDGPTALGLAQVDRGRMVSDAQVEALATEPPAGGRDALRVGLLRRFADEIDSCDWHWVSRRDGNCYLLPDPTTGLGHLDLAGLPTLAKAAEALGLTAVRPEQSVVVLVGPPSVEGGCLDNAGPGRPENPANKCHSAGDTQDRESSADIPRTQD